MHQDKNYYKMQLCFNIEIEDKHIINNKLKETESKRIYVPPSEGMQETLLLDTSN